MSILHSELKREELEDDEEEIGTPTLRVKPNNNYAD